MQDKVKECVRVLENIKLYDLGKNYKPGYLHPDNVKIRSEALSFAISILEKLTEENLEKIVMKVETEQQIGSCAGHTAVKNIFLPPFSKKVCSLIAIVLLQELGK